MPAHINGLQCARFCGGGGNVADVLGGPLGGGGGADRGGEDHEGDGRDGGGGGVHGGSCADRRLDQLSLISRDAMITS